MYFILVIYIAINGTDGFHEFLESVSSIFFLQKMIYHKIHIWNFWDLYELLFEYFAVVKVFIPYSEGGTDFI